MVRTNCPICNANLIEENICDLCGWSAMWDAQTDETNETAD